MTNILIGPVADRPAHAMYPMTAAEARGVIVLIERDVPSISKRKKLTAIYSTNIGGKLSADAVAVYRAYSAS